MIHISDQWENCFLIFQETRNPTPLYSDSQAAIVLTWDGSYHACTKHINIQYHFILFVVNNGTINLIYCPTDNMVAITLTKALPNIKLKYFTFALSLRSTWKGSAGIFKADYTGASSFPYMVCKYVLPIHHWTWCYHYNNQFMGILFTITQHALTYLNLLINNNYCHFCS